MPLVALFTSILVGWVLGPKWMANVVRENGQSFKLEGLITIMIKWIVPLISLAVFISSMMMTFGNLAL
jgi:neurotransmitter:Na+ symporter, NSS family